MYILLVFKVNDYNLNYQKKAIEYIFSGNILMGPEPLLNTSYHSMCSYLL